MASVEHSKWSAAVVCHITTVHPPLDDRIFHRECLSLRQEGYEVHLIACHDRDECVDGVNIHSLPAPPNRLMRGLLWPWKALHKVLALRPAPVICHLHDPELLPIGQVLRLRGFKVIYDVHENVANQIRFKRYLPPILRVFLSQAYRFGEGILTSGIATLHVLRSISRNYRKPKAIVRNLPRVTDAPVACPLQASQRPRLIYVGGITRCRGALTMIQTAKELHLRGVDFELCLVGQMEDEHLAREIRDEVASAAISEKVCLLGRVPFDQAMREVASSHIGLCLLMPEPNYLNSLATKILEYMLSGLPVVASDFPVWKEFVTDTGAGIQVDVLSVKSIADAIQSLIEDPDRMRQMARRGMAAVRSKYCWEKEQHALLAFYRRLIKRSDHENSRCQSV